MRIRTIKPEFWRSPDVMALSLFERLLWIGLWSMADDHGRGRAYAPEIAADLFLTEYSLNPHGVLTEVSRGLQSLSDREMITLYSCDGRHYFQVNRWNDHQKINRPSMSRFPSLEHPHSLTEYSVSAHGVLTDGSLQEQGTGNREQGTGNRSSTAPKSDRHALEWFADFWEVVPRKTGKQAALKAWGKAVGVEEPEVIIEAMRAYRDDPNRADEFTKHPATWLNQGCWEDDPLPARSRDGSPEKNDLDMFMAGHESLGRSNQGLDGPLADERSLNEHSMPPETFNALDGPVDVEFWEQEPPPDEPPPDPQDDNEGNHD